MKFQQRHTTFSIDELLTFNDKGKINLNPGFQRNSVWSDVQKRKLIDSLLQNMPIPTMFFWERKEGNKVIYDVIDGKQRTEAILAFVRKKAPIDVQIDPEDDPDWSSSSKAKWTWKKICADAPKKARDFKKFRIPVVLVEGSLDDIERLFVRINSTGSKLTKAEMLHAKWHQSSKLLAVSSKLAQKYQNYFIELGILSKGQISRMKAVELIAELILSFEGNQVLNKKDALDSVMRHEKIHQATLIRLSKDVDVTFAWIKKFFPDIVTTRFKKVPDFYTLAFTIWKLKKHGYVLEDKVKSQLALSLLKKMSTDIAISREDYERNGKSKLQSPALEYHATVISGSDASSHRRRRVEIIESLITPILETKSTKRGFSDHQKQLLWHSLAEKKCVHCGLAIKGWNDVHVDHKHPHARGGASSVKNAQLLHAKCNQSLGVKGL